MQPPTEEERPTALSFENLKTLKISPGDNIIVYTNEDITPQAFMQFARDLGYALPDSVRFAFITQAQVAVINSDRVYYDPPISSVVDHRRRPGTMTDEEYRQWVEEYRAERKRERDGSVEQ